MRDRTLQTPNGSIRLLGTIPGLRGEEAHVESFLDRERPRRVLLLLPPSDLEALRTTNWRAIPEEELLVDDLDYIQGLEHFGDVQLVPSPDLTAILDWTKANDVETLAVDLDDDAHADLFTSTIGILDLRRRMSARKKQARVRPSKFQDVEAWILAREAPILAVPNLKAIELARLQWAFQNVQEGDLLQIPMHLWPLVDEAIPAGTNA